MRSRIAIASNFGGCTGSRLAGLALALAALSLAPLTAAAGDRGAGFGGGPPSPEQRLAQLTQKLDLTEEQQGKLGPILKAHDEEMRALFEKARSTKGSDRSALRSQMKASHERFETQVSSVLTEQQMTQFRKLQEERRERMRGHRRGGPGGGAPPDTGADTDTGD